MTVDDDTVTRQLQRAARSITSPPTDLVDATIAEGRRRLRKRGRHRLAGAILGAAVLGSGATYLTLSSSEPSPEPPVSSVPIDSATSDEHAAKLLARRLNAATPARIEPGGHQPAWLLAAWAQVGVRPNLTDSDSRLSRLLTVTATARSAASRERRTTNAALLLTKALPTADRDAILSRCDGPEPVSCLRSDLGTVVVLDSGEGGPTVVNLFTPSGWLVQASAEDSRVVTALQLTQLVMDGGWLR